MKVFGKIPPYIGMVYEMQLNKNSRTMKYLRRVLSSPYSNQLLKTELAVTLLSSVLMSPVGMLFIVVAALIGHDVLSFASNNFVLIN